MSLLEKLIPRVGQERRAREAEELAKQTALQNREMDKLSLRDIANQAGDTELRKRVGLDVGPMTQEQTGLSGEISKSLMDNPEELAMRIPASQAQKYNPVLDMLATRKNNQYAQSKGDELLKLRKEQMKNLQDQRAAMKRERMGKNLEGIVNKFNADPGVRKSEESIDSAKLIRGMVDSDNPIAAAAVPTIMARASREVGNLSEADKAPFGGSQAMLERLNQIIKTAGSGRMTEANKSYVRGLANLFEKNGRDAKKRLASERAKGYSSIPEYPSEQDILNAFNVEYGLPDYGQGPTSALSPEEEQELKSLEQELGEK
jgi:hypothetical protein